MERIIEIVDSNGYLYARDENHGDEGCYLFSMALGIKDNCIRVFQRPLAGINIHTGKHYITVTKAYDSELLIHDDYEMHRDFNISESYMGANYVNDYYLETVIIDMDKMKAERKDMSDNFLEDAKAAFLENLYQERHNQSFTQPY